ncbi:MAG TPA: gamma-glutamylcyclotransferase [Saprospiraceae bacterium]|nr:gamma-glutamylcyclotransferase [Saprospiraceae bacterium]
MNKYIFVYGTLMSSFDNPAAKRLKEEATLIGKATINGSLYQLERYPAVVFDSKDKVHGELYELHDENSFAWIDQYEEVPILYVRRKVKAKCEGIKYKCYAYEYAGHVYQYAKIEGGNYLNILV